MSPVFSIDAEKEQKGKGSRRVNEENRKNEARSQRRESQR